VQVEQISKEQNYQRYREERFRLTSESTNQRVLWYAKLTFYQPHFRHFSLRYTIDSQIFSRWFSRSLFLFHNYFGVPGTIPDPGSGVFCEIFYPWILDPGWEKNLDPRFEDEHDSG
jgi:hypothetical protein